MRLFLGLLLAAVTVLEILIFIYFYRYEKSLAIKAYLAVIAGVVIWVGSNCLTLFSANVDVTILQKFTWLGGTLLTSSFLLFIYSFPYPKGNNIKVLSFFPALSTFFFGYLLFFTDSFVTKIELVGTGTAINKTSISLWTWSIFFLLTWIFALRKLIQRYHESEGQTRYRIKNLVIGISISLLASIVLDVLMPLIGHQNIIWVSPALSIVWLGLTVKAVRI